ncbi:hypothetical protein [Arthrospiribacter ruber]|uniref:Uncharacterized protein n=1 Tax=Arthrospiribacter ruber TaxID=2487934 RepID=A0A951MDR7_9BACT|nr:hypothetical protein [Arthrospiribacter ruber]MBW3469254.1 hypothetical protein [Arthrospiribacter ruber]
MEKSIQEQQLEGLNELFSEIRKDVEEATLMASKVSEKFKTLSEGIHDMSGVFAKAFKNDAAGAAVHVAGYAVNLAGKAFSSIKKSYELQKLLPKKKELARNKRSIIESHSQNLESRLPKLKRLLELEIAHEFESNDIKLFEEGHGKNCCSAFEVYVMSLHLYKVCDFLVSEFDAWEKDFHDSDKALPYLHNSLYQIINECLAPEGLNNLVNKSNGALFLFVKYESLLGSILINEYNEALQLEKENEKYDKKVAFSDKESYLKIRNKVAFLNDLYSNNDPKKNWIKNNYFFQEVNKVQNIQSLFFDVSKYIFMGSFALIVVITFDVISAILGAAFITPIVYLIDQALQFSKNRRFRFQNTPISERILGGIINIICLGGLWYGKKRRKEKEENYVTLFTNLNSLNSF